MMIKVTLGNVLIILTSKYLHTSLFPFYKARKAKAYI